MLHLFFPLDCYLLAKKKCSGGKQVMLPNKSLKYLVSPAGLEPAGDY
jgi:hypothetical protein